MVRKVVVELAAAQPGHVVEVEIADGMYGEVDSRLVRTVLVNLLSNAWKYSAKVERPRIVVGILDDGATRFVRDNGAGFDAAAATTLFVPFERFHSDAEFAGTGIGLATVHRIVERLGERIWAESRPGHGARFPFTLGPRG